VGVTDSLTTNQSIAMTRQGQIVDKILFLDGISGTGKTMMGPVLGSFNGVELGRFEYNFEYLCALNVLGKIDGDAAVFMIKMLADLCIYNMMISREVNFRPTDLSGIFSNPNTWRYLKRLFVKDGRVVLDRIKNENPVLHLVSHQSLGIMKPIFEAFASRVHVIEMVRHPAYLVDHWLTYIDRFGTDPRDFTVCFDYEGKSLPWFAHGWEEKYVQASSMDKVIYTLENLIHRSENTKKNIPDELRKNVLTVPFERFVLNPEPDIRKIEQVLSTEATAATYKVLQGQKVPRLQVAAGPNKEIYRRYAWVNPNPKMTDQEELKQKREAVESKLSLSAREAFIHLCQDYEKAFGLWF